MTPRRWLVNLGLVALLSTLVFLPSGLGQTSSPSSTATGYSLSPSSSAYWSYPSHEPVSMTIYRANNHHVHEWDDSFSHVDVFHFMGFQHGHHLHPPAPPGWNLLRVCYADTAPARPLDAPLVTTRHQYTGEWPSVRAVPVEMRQVGDGEVEVTWALEEGPAARPNRGSDGCGARLEPTPIRVPVTTQVPVVTLTASPVPSPSE